MSHKRISLFSIIVATLFHVAGCSSQKNYIHPQVKIDIENLRATVNQLTTVTPQRNFDNPESLNNVAEYIKNKFTEYGLNPVEQRYEVDNVTYKNIIASWGPHDLPVLVIGAHYDVYAELPGADDNASGVAGIVELGRLISKNKPTLNYRIELVAYTLEEPPFFRTENMGSFIHASSLHEKNTKLLGMVSLEMIGYFTEAEDSQEYPVSIMKLFYPKKGNYIAVVGNFSSSSLSRHFAENISSTPINTEKLNAPSFIPGIDFSDHMNYWKFGYKAIMITDTSFYRNSNYHEKTDTIDTLNFHKMSEVIQGVYWSLLNLKV
jgi:Zn-dependent M28 family amino/carboxypeptidase